MDWDYLEAILPLYSVPPQMTRWTMACVRSAEYSLVFNGQGGSGFFRPKCGLRQGCSLSPYLFLFKMDLLSRRLSQLVEEHKLKGLKMAPACNPITNALYTDDLLIFGYASQQEAALIMETSHDFTRVSGQQVGPTKSTLWFNNCTNPVLRKQVSDIFLVNSSAVTTTYLGAPIATTAQAFDFLVESFSSRLQAWKSKLLSQAGRIVLIKAVLQSVPIYYMATTIIPQKVLSKLTSLIRRFYWGKVDQPRYMALLS